MDQKKRLCNALRRSGVDRAPFICPGGMMNMAVSELMEMTGCSWPQAHIDPHSMAALTLAANRISGVENLGVPFCMTVEAEALGAKIDLGSADREPSVCAYSADRIEQAGILTNLDPEAGRAGVCAEAVRILHITAPDLPIFANITGPVSLATSLLDPMVFYRALITQKEAAHKFMQQLVQALITFGSSLIEAGADLVCIADPSASGELIGKKAFSEFALPYINMLVKYFRDKYEVPSIVHICGRIQSLGSAIAMVEADCISVDAVVNLRLLRELAPEKVVMGNVNTYLMANGSPDHVFKNGRRCISSGAEILAPACGVSTKTPVKNLRALSCVVLSG